jgi:hypothetical protein
MIPPALPRGCDRLPVVATFESPGRRTGPNRQDTDPTVIIQPGLASVHCFCRFSGEIGARLPGDDDEFRVYHVVLPSLP